MKYPTTLTILALLIFVGVAQANVFNMGPTLTSIEFVTVGDPGNTNDTLTGYGGVAKTYSIDKYEVTAGQYTEFLNAVAATDTYGLYNPSMWSDTNYGCRIQRDVSPSGYTYSVADDWANRPVNYVSWGDAARFTNWLHNKQLTGDEDLSTTEDGAYYLNGATSDADLMAVTRKDGANFWIPTENEWYKAAYYKGGGKNEGYWLYPTQSSNNPPGRDMSEATNQGNNANYNGTLTDPIDAGHYTTVAGEFELSHSAYGTFDQGGNVWEWNESSGLTDSTRYLRGGAWYSPANYLAADSFQFDRIPSYESSGLGFRVACPEPNIFMLLGMGALGLALYGWQRQT